MVENVRTFLRVGDVACMSRDDRSLRLVAAWIAPHLPGQLGDLAFTIVELLVDGETDSAFGAWRYLRGAIKTLVDRGEYLQAAV